MRRFLFISAFVTTAFICSTATTQSTSVDFEAQLQIQADGQPALNSKFSLLQGITPVVLPPSMWQCVIRAPVRDNGLVSRETMCWVNDKTGKSIAQVGTLTICGASIPEDVSMLYVREGNRLFRIIVSCELKP